jgi:hypothetical protein
MSKLIRVLALVAMVAAMHLAGMAVVAQAHPADQVTGQDARRPPTERQVGEAWRKRPPATSRPTTWTALSGSGSGTAPPSPAGHPPRCQPRCPPNRADSPGGSSLHSVSWPRPWPSSPGSPCWSPGGRAAGFGPGRPPDPGSPRNARTASPRRARACGCWKSAPHHRRHTAHRRSGRARRPGAGGLRDRVDHGGDVCRAGLRRAGVSRRTGRSAVRDAGPGRSRSAAAGPACP